MKILIVAATSLEISSLSEKLIFIEKPVANLSKYKYNNLFIDILITGIGGIFTSYWLLKYINNNYDLILNIGIAGSYNDNIRIGQVVNIVKDEFADLGIEDANEFRTLFDMKFVDKNTYPFNNGKLDNNTDFSKIIKLKKVKAISSSIAHGNKNSINKIIEKFNPDIESMEGATFFYICTLEQQSFLQIRSISNFVEERKKSNWNIPLAINNLADTIINIFDSSSFLTLLKSE